MFVFACFVCATALPPKIDSSSAAAAEDDLISSDPMDGGWGGSAGGLKIFSNNFRFAANVTKVFRQDDALLLVALEGDAARQPYYREGNGLNVGLYGAVGMLL